MTAVRPVSPAEGISVVLPVYRGEAEVGACLSSLAAQTLDPALFEVIVVINGEPDATAAILEDFRLRHPKLDIRVVTTRKPGAGRARNAGLAAARFSFTTFVDHDDHADNGLGRLEAARRTEARRVSEGERHPARPAP